MNDVFNLANSYIQGKPVYPSIRRFFNLLFNVSIASFLFEYYYGEYSWYNYNDYKRILDFFIKGQFFIPFSIFVVVLFVTQIFAVVVFYIFNLIRSKRLQQKIITLQFNREEIDQSIAELQPITNYISPVDITVDMVLEGYTKVRETITPEVFQDLENELKVPRQNLELNFCLAFRMLIAISVYKATLANFSLWLYIITVLILFMVMLFLMFCYRLLDILPFVLKKFHYQIEEYLRNQQYITKK